MKPIEEILNDLNPFDGVIGISPELRVFCGYDEGAAELWNTPPEWMVAHHENLQDWGESQAPPEIRRAIAEEMIRRWTAYRDEIEK